MRFAKAGFLARIWLETLDIPGHCYTSIYTEEIPLKLLYFSPEFINSLKVDKVATGNRVKPKRKPAKILKINKTCG